MGGCVYVSLILFLLLPSNIIHITFASSNFIRILFLFKFTFFAPTFFDSSRTLLKSRSKQEQEMENFQFTFLFDLLSFLSSFSILVHTHSRLPSLNKFNNFSLSDTKNALKQKSFPANSIRNFFPLSRKRQLQQITSLMRWAMNENFINTFCVLFSLFNFFTWQFLWSEISLFSALTVKQSSLHLRSLRVTVYLWKDFLMWLTGKRKSLQMLLSVLHATLPVQHYNNDGKQCGKRWKKGKFQNEENSSRMRR